MALVDDTSQLAVLEPDAGADNVGVMEPAAPAKRRHRKLTIAAVIIAVLGALAGGFLTGRATAPDDKSPAAAAGSPTPSTPVTDQAPVSSIDALLQEALSFHTASNFVEATRLYNEVLASDPGNKYAHFNLGQIAQTAGDFDTAITQYLAALDTDPNYGPALYNSGLAYGADGDRTNGIAMLRRALVVSPDSAPTMFNLGTMLIADGSDTEGADFIAQAIAIDPTLEPAG